MSYHCPDDISVFLTQNRMNYAIISPIPITKQAQDSARIFRYRQVLFAGQKNLFASALLTGKRHLCDKKVPQMSFG